MFFQAFSFLTLLLTLSPVDAAPNPRVVRAPAVKSRQYTSSRQNFYLVATTSCEPASNSSTLPNVKAINIFDPFYQEPYWLRTIDPGYYLLPQYNISSNGTLSTFQSGPHGFGMFSYQSVTPAAGKELELYPRTVGVSDLSLVNGYLLAVGGETKGWGLCTKEDNTYLGQTVVVWKSNDTLNCQDVYFQAVSTPPY